MATAWTSSAERFLGHKPIAFTEVAGSGRNFIGFARVPIDKATRIRGRGRRRDAAAVAGAEAASRRRAHDDGLRDAGAAAGRRSLARMERRGISIDRADAVAARPANSRQSMARLEAEIQRDRRRAVQSRLAQAARRHPVRPDGPARRQEDRDRRLVDHGERARRPRRGGPRAAGARPRLAADRRSSSRPTPTRCRASSIRATRPGAHLLRARRDDDRPALVVRAESAEHSGPHRGGPQDPPRLRRRAGRQADLGRLQPDRAAPARPYRRHPAR